MQPETINISGPRCAWCGTRPDDPVWAQPRGQTKDISCLGCVADQRAQGTEIRVIGRAWTPSDVVGEVRQ